MYGLEMSINPGAIHRRLVDRYPVDGDRGVCSLRAIVNDAKRHRQHLTRRVYVETIAGLEYDYAAVRERHWQFILAQGPGPIGIPRELQYELSEDRHREFDWLSGVAEDARSEGDVIQDQIFVALEARLAALDTIAEHGDIYFAHAATQASREGRGLVSWNRDDAKDAIRQIAEISELVGRWFCYTGIGDVLPHAQYDQFQYLDRPWFIGEQDRLRQSWQEFADEVAQWPYIANEAL